jgi:F-type H+-transporting ATPase subunit delta
MKYSRDDIAKAFVKRADKVGVKRAAKDLAALMLEQRMHEDADQIIQDIMSEYAKSHGVIEANIKTAYPLSGDLKKQIEERVKNKTNAKKVLLNEEIDNSLLGGVVISAPGMELDLSIKSKLAKLKA